MDQQAEMQIELMYAAFQTGKEDPDLRMRTLKMDLRNAAPSAIIEAATRFRHGQVEGQSLKFGPSVPEFLREVTRIAERDERIAKPVKAVEFRSNGYAPIDITIQKIKDRFAGRPILHENVTQEKMRQLMPTCPTGSTWCWYRQAIFGPASGKGVI